MLFCYTCCQHRIDACEQLQEDESQLKTLARGQKANAATSGKCKWQICPKGISALQKKGGSPRFLSHGTYHDVLTDEVLGIRLSSLMRQFGVR